MIKILYANVSPLSNDTVYEAAYRLLPDFRQKKADKLKFRSDKNLSVGAWLLLRHSLTEAGYDCNSLKFDVEKSSKPYIICDLSKPLHFSLSHSGNIALAAISDSPIGADVEEIGNFNPDICKRFFTKKERDSIMRQCDEESRKEMFFRIWTLKESYVKMTGKGISGFSQCEFVPDKELSVCADMPGCVFGEFDLGSYRAAVCSKSEEEAKAEAFGIVNILI